jgi:hypothetical protein
MHFGLRMTNVTHHQYLVELQAVMALQVIFKFTDESVNHSEQVLCLHLHFSYA